MLRSIGRCSLLAVATVALLTSEAPPASAEILALVNYESKSPDALKAFKRPVRGTTRTEGIAVIDVDPASPRFGKIVRDIPLPPDTIAHHIFYNRDQTKGYVTALGKTELRVIDLTRDDLPVKTVEVPDCKVGEDVVFSEDNRTWYVTCMGSGVMVVGDAVTDRPTRTVTLPKPYPHGIAIHNGIDRILVTNTVRASDLGDPGETITAIEASSGKVLDTYKVSEKPSPSGEAPVEIVFVPGSNPPVAYVTNMLGGTLWTATWAPASKGFKVAKAWDFAAQKAGVPLEIYFDDGAKRMFVTTAKPGHLHVFDIAGDPGKPRLRTSIPTAEGAHHVAFTKDMRWGFVQNSLLNLPGMSDGSISVIDLEKGTKTASIDTLKDDGFNPNSIVLLPRWNHLAGH